jgi:bacillithiol synthase
LYFIYKIISTLKLAEQLKKHYPDYDFVPVYWMATEDHDFEEISSFTFKGKKIHWNTLNKGAVGRLSTAGLQAVFEVFSKELGAGKNAEALRDLFQSAYLKANNLAEATRFLVNELFGLKGLVIIDGDDYLLKKQFAPYIEEELQNKTAFKTVAQAVKQMNGYKIQVNPRDINLFYLEDNLRERIVFADGKFRINHTDLIFSEAEILEELYKSPEKFSPNVIMRPLYQEVVLPNLAYVGGGGEIAYWLQLKTHFKTQNITFPILVLRDSVVVITEKQEKKIQKLNLSVAELFFSQHHLLALKAKEFSEFPIDLSDLKQTLQQQFNYLHTLTQKTDASFLGAVKAQEKKQLNGLQKLEKRLLKAQSRKHAAVLERIVALQNEIFPNKSLQERQLNFSEFYLEYGEDFFDKLFKIQSPLELKFKTLRF